MSYFSNLFVNALSNPTTTFAMKGLNATRNATTMLFSMFSFIEKFFFNVTRCCSSSHREQAGLGVRKEKMRLG